MKMKWLISDSIAENKRRAFVVDEEVVAEGIDMLSPLNLQIGQPVLVVILEDNLRNIAENIKRGFKLNEELVAYRQHMESWLAWARKAGDTDGNVFMSISPVNLSDEAEIDDEDEPGSDL